MKEYITSFDELFFIASGIRSVLNVSDIMEYPTDYIRNIENMIIDVDDPAAIANAMKNYKRIVIGEGISSITPYTFYNVDTIVSVEFPDCVTVGYSCFMSCVGLLYASFPKCSFIGEFAFLDCLNLLNVYFPKCERIETGAFQYCVNLEDADFQKASIVENSAFHGCSYLSRAIFPKCSYVGYKAFCDCDYLKNIHFPECSSIGSSAFMNCGWLSSGDIFSTLIRVNSYGFCGCGFKSIDLPECSIVDGFAFASCFNLEKISLSVCDIVYSSAFIGCSFLSEVRFYNDVTFYNNVFYNCVRLLSLYLFGSPRTPVSYSVFHNTPISNNTSIAGRFGSIFVLSSFYQSYLDHPFWGIYSARLVSI